MKHRDSWRLARGLVDWAWSAPPPLPELRCSFCGTAQREVRKLVAGPGVRICDECIALAASIVAEEAGVFDAAGGRKP